MPLTPEQLRHAQQVALEEGDTELAQQFAQELAAATDRGLGPMRGLQGIATNVMEAAAPFNTPGLPEVDVAPLRALGSAMNPATGMSMFEPALLQRIAYLFAPSEEARARILKQMVPGATMGATDGSVTMTPPLAPGEMGPPAPQFVNRPGVSPIDLERAGGDTAIAATTLPLAGASMLGRAGISGATSLTEDAIARAGGGGNEISLPKAGMYAAGSAVADVGAAAFRSAKGIAEWIRSKVAPETPTSALYNELTGQFTKRAQDLMGRFNVDISRLSPDAYPAFAAYLEKGANPADAFRLVQAQTLPEPVRLSAAAIRQDPALYSMEDQLARGGTDLAINTVKNRRDAQGNALRSGMDELSSAFGGGRGPMLADEASGAGAQVQAQLAKLRESFAGRRDALYESAQNRYAFLEPAYVDGIVQRIERQLTSTRGPRSQPTFHPDDIPKALGTLARLRAAGDRVVGIDVAPPGSGARYSEVRKADLADVMDFRKKLKPLIDQEFQNGSYTADGAALIQVKKALDIELSDLFRRGAVSGDTEALQGWKAAIGAHRDLKEIFDAEDLVGRMLEKGPDGKLKMAPEQAMNAILGKRYAGFSPASTQRDLLKLRNILGPESEEWASVKQSALQRLFRMSEGASSGAGFGLSGDKFKKGLDRAMAQFPDAFTALVSRSEQAQLKQLADVMQLATSKMPNTGNPPGTAAALMKSLQGTTKAGMFSYGVMKAMTEGDPGALKVAMTMLPAMGAVKGGMDAYRTRLLGSQAPRQLPAGRMDALTRRSLLTSILGQLWQTEGDSGTSP